MHTGIALQNVSSKIENEKWGQSSLVSYPVLRESAYGEGYGGLRESP